MLTALVANLLILGVAGYLMTQGLFSSMIMTVLTLLSAAVALSFYEPLAQATLYAQLPAYADGICLIGLFAVTLGVLRILYDWLVGGDVMFGLWVNRVAGATFGVISGMIIVGILLISVQMLPFGASMFPYRMFDDALQRTGTVPIFYPDDFALGAVKVLSAGSLSSEQSFQQVHRDLLLEVFCARNTAGTGCRIDAPADALRKVEVYAQLPTGIDPNDIPPNPLLEPGTVERTIVVRTTVDASAGDEEDKWLRLPATHFRLVTSRSRNCYPVAYLTYWVEANTQSGGPDAFDASQAAWQCVAAEIADRKAQVAKLLLQRPGKGSPLVIDWIYRIPRDETPQYMVFRRTSTADIAGKVDGSAPPQNGALSRKAGKAPRR